MRVIVIMSPDRPVDLLAVPESVTASELDHLAQALDFVSVDNHVLTLSENASLIELEADVSRFLPEDLEDTEPACQDASGSAAAHSHDEVP